MAGIDLNYAFRLPPEQAVAYFRGKVDAPISWDWQDLWQEAHAKAFTVAKALRVDVLQDIRDAVDRALAEGQTLAEFRRDLEPRLKAKGWWGKVMVGDGAGGAQQVQLGSPWRLKTIYRTNIQTAYMAGRWQALMANIDDRPYLQYVAVLDSRTRPTHRALHGKVFRYDDPFWRYLYPPNGWGCRCRVRALSQADIDARGLRVEQSGKRLSMEEALVSKQTGELREVAAYRFNDPVTGKPLTMRPDVGWSYNPGMAWQANLEDILADKLNSAHPAIVAIAVGEMIRAGRFAKWVDEVLARNQARGERKIIGLVAPYVRRFVEQKGVALESQVLLIDDKGLLHAARDTKAERGAALSREELRQLPELITKAEMVLWDTQDPALLYVFASEDKKGKVVVRVNQRRKGETINRVVTTGRVKAEDLNNPRYEEVVEDR